MELLYIYTYNATKVINLTRFGTIFSYRTLSHRVNSSIEDGTLIMNCIRGNKTTTTLSTILTFEEKKTDTRMIEERIKILIISNNNNKISNID